MKFTTICDVSHVISYTRPSSPLFFSGGIERKAWERGYTTLALYLEFQTPRVSLNDPPPRWEVLMDLCKGVGLKGICPSGINTGLEWMLFCC